MIQSMSMNRKQRRLQEKKAGKKTSLKSRNDAAKAAELKAQGMALKNAGNDADAVPLLKEALKLAPSMADVHFSLAMTARLKPELGVDMDAINKSLPEKSKETLLQSYSAILIILRKKRQYEESQICQEEFCRLLPDDPMALMDLGLIKNITGGTEEAVLNMSRAMIMAPDNPVIKSVFASSINTPSFSQFYPEVKEAILECFKDIYSVNLFRMPQPWLNLMLHDPLYTGMFETNTMRTYEEFYEWAEQLDATSGAFLKDPYFIEGIRLLILAYVGMEQTLTWLRRYILLNFEGLVESGRIELFDQFIPALAEQCFLNEFVYNEETDESEALAKLIAKTNSTPDKMAIGVIACYQSLYDVFRDQKDVLHKYCENDEFFARLVKTQWDDPAKEAELKKDIPVFGEFANEISKAVQSQYEVNPYPRWITICAKPMPTDDHPHNSLKDAKIDVLIAGCGTGRQPISSAARNPNSKVTAIDLSRASIAYGKRKALECGLDKQIEFVHADILSMANWDKQFDIIECSGVLHHMEDPLEGWRALNSILKPNGYFKIGLYSEAARQEIVNARNFIKEHGFDSSVQGIRDCRQAIFDLPTTDPMRKYLLQTGDFFATSLVRDLIFHVQEHRMTLPQIKEMMDELGLVCKKFSISNPETIAQYEKMFPKDLDRSNFDNWIEFEEKFPLTFRSMYQFWCQKTT